MIEVFAIGGYSEVGKNMTAIKVDDEIIILDMGLYLPAVLKYEEGDPRELTTKDLIKIGAIPDDEVLHKYKNQVKAIVLGHCHLDHIGAAPFLARHYDCPVIGTRYTIEVLKKLLEEHEYKLEGRLKPINSGTHLEISENLKIEFINITHSTPQTVLIAIHTKYGIIFYANDFKLDNYPVIGAKPNYDRLKHLAEKENVLLAFTVARILGFEAKKIVEAINSFERVIGRLDYFEKQGHHFLIDFAHTPNAYQQLYKSISTKRSGSKRIIHVFGCAGERDQYKRAKMGEIAAANADILVITEEDYRHEDIEKIMDEIEGGIPKDPKGSANPLTWNTLSTSYCVCATLEAGVGNAIAPSSTTCNWSDTGTYYCATNKQ